MWYYIAHNLHLCLCRNKLYLNRSISEYLRQGMLFISNYFKENYCLCLNKNEQAIYRGKLYEGGRYWLGAGFKFIEFPRMQMAYVWSSTYKQHRNFEDDSKLVTVRSSDIMGRSQDGLKITISLSIHYKVGTQFTN